MNPFQYPSDRYGYGFPDELDADDLGLVMKHLKRKLRAPRGVTQQLFAARFPCGDFTQYVVMSRRLKDVCNVFENGQRYRSVCRRDARLPRGAQLVEATPIDDREWEPLAQMSCFQRYLNSKAPSKRAKELAGSMAAAQFEAGGAIGNVLVLSDTFGNVDIVVRSPRGTHRHVAHVGVPAHVTASA
jgi:hypothetical protein